MKPKLLLHFEGAAVLLVASYLYYHTEASWRLFAALFLVPDLSMFGYLINRKVGAIFYNLAHTYTAPLLAWLILLIIQQSPLYWLVLIWFAHIGWDRLLGYGLKYETAFKDTHLQRV